MQNLYNERKAEQFISTYAAYPKEFALRVYTSRLIGSDPRLVLHGGGNTSVKLKHINLFGEKQDILYIKGSGIDLKTIEPLGFTGLDLTALRKFRRLDSLSTEDMENQLHTLKIAFNSPTPSVETLLHAFLPHRFIDHTHADGILTLTNQMDGEKFIKEAMGETVAFLPYSFSGLPIAQLVVSAYEKQIDVEAIIIQNHGIFTFGADAKTSYDRMITYVRMAECFIQKRITYRKAETPSAPKQQVSNEKTEVSNFAQVVRGCCAYRISQGNLRRFFVEVRNRPSIVKLSLLAEAQDWCKTGVLTPDHATRTKNEMVFVEALPNAHDALREQLMEKIEIFKNNYDQYFHTQSKAKGVKRKKLDPFPRCFLVAGLGLFCLGLSRKEARIAADIAEHNLYAKQQAALLGKYAPIADTHIFDMEYWGLQQKKIERSMSELQGQVAVITGGGGAIGYGIANRLLASGAAVALIDIDKFRLNQVRDALIRHHQTAEVEIIPADVTEFKSLEHAFVEISYDFGGIDIVVPNAGVAHVSKIETMSSEKWDQITAVNLKGTFLTIKASIPIFRRQRTGGNIVVISSKNVFDPGQAFGAYSASKAGAHQISKIAALELAELGIRVNMVNPDAVFGEKDISSKLWDLIGPDRMKSRGLDKNGLKTYYQNRNLLKTAVLAAHVGNAVVFFASEQTPTTGASIPVDGGIPAAFPR